MTFKKNLLSYFLWISYAFLACTGLIGILFIGLNDTPFSSIYAKISIICLSFVLAAGIFSLIRRVNKSSQNKYPILLEAFSAVILLGIGVFLRVYFMNGGTEEAAYYEVAKVTGETIKPVAHGVQYIYVNLLRGLFLLIGNFFIGGIILQICLQCLAVVIWYFIIRKYAGNIASVIFLSVVMLLPSSIKAAITYSPKILYLLLWGIAFWFIAQIAENHQKSGNFRFGVLLRLIVTGCLIGIFSYLDVSGIVLVIPVIALCFLQRDQNLNDGERNFPSVLQCFIIFMSFIISAFASFYIDSFMNQESLLNVMQVWVTLFQYKGMVSLHTLEATALALNNQIWMVAIIAFLVVLGVPAIFVKKKSDIQMLWFTMALGVGIIWVCNFHYPGMTCEQLMLFLISAMAGVGIKAIWGDNDSETEAVAKKDVPANKDSMDHEELDNNTNTHIHYIDNPLPLPKKPVKKVMDYQREVPLAQMNFDIEVSDIDDFDI